MGTRSSPRQRHWFSVSRRNDRKDFIYRTWFSWIAKSITPRTDIEYFSAIIDTCPAPVFPPDLGWKPKGLVFSDVEAAQRIHKIRTGTSHLVSAKPCNVGAGPSRVLHSQSVIRDPKERRKRSSVFAVPSRPRNYQRRGREWYR